jgi:uncharacterized cupredoxin-like copper-binding protein
MKRYGCAILIAASLGACAPHGPKGTIATLEPPAAIDWGTARPLEVVLADFSFTPETLRLAEGHPYRLHFLNQGSGTHDFSAPDFFRTVALPPGAASLPDRIVVARGANAEVTLVPLRKGSWASECTVPLHSTFGMTGKVVVD